MAQAQGQLGQIAPIDGAPKAGPNVLNPSVLNLRSFIDLLANVPYSIQSTYASQIVSWETYCEMPEQAEEGREVGSVVL